MDITISCKLARLLFVTTLFSLTFLTVTRADTGKSTAVFVTDHKRPTVSKTRPSTRGAVAFVQPVRTASNQRPAPKFVPAQPGMSPGSHKNFRQQVANAQASPLRQTAHRQSAQNVLDPPGASSSRTVLRASHTEPTPNEQSKIPELDEVTRLLLEAHNLSQHANTEEDHSQIINNCSEAIGLGASDEKELFARKLASWSLNRRGQLRLDAGQQITADTDFQAAIDFNPKNWRALHNRGVSRAQMGALADAFDDFNRALEINSKYAKAYSNRATLFVQANDLQSALEDYQRAKSLDPQLAAAHLGMGRVCHTLGRLDEAFEHFSRAVQSDPTNADIICSRGDLQADMGRYAGALADYARTIELDPEFGHAYRNGAWLLATCPNASFRDPDNAILGARQAIDIGYGEPHVAIDTLAAAQASAGDFQQAVNTINQAIEIAPEESKFAYLSRLQMYQEGHPFRTEPVGNISQAVFEATDKK